MLTETLSCSAYLLFALSRTSRHFLFLRFLDRHYLTTRPNSAKARIYISTKARSDGNMRRRIYILLIRNLEDASVTRARVLCRFLYFVNTQFRRRFRYAGTRALPLMLFTTGFYILLIRNLEDASVTRARVLCRLCSSLPVYFRLHMETYDGKFTCYKGISLSIRA